MNDDQENVFDDAIKDPQKIEESSVDLSSRVPAKEQDREDSNPPQSSLSESGAETEGEQKLLAPEIPLPPIETKEEILLLPKPQSEGRALHRQIPTAIAFSVFGVLIGSILPLSHNARRQTPPPESGLASTFSVPTKNVVPQTKVPLADEDTFDTLKLEAKAAYVWDINARAVLFKKNADLQLPLASIAKVMTAVTISEEVPRGAIVTIDRSALKTEGDTGLLSGEQWRLRDLLEFTLLVSSNDGAEALASIANTRLSANASSTTSFINSMNKKAQEIGLTHSYFSNPSGLDTDEQTSGAYGSARDMARLFEYALHTIPEAFEATTYSDTEITSLSGFIHDARNTNILTNKIPALIASKTGFTNLAGGNLVVAFEAGPGKKIVVAVLGSTYEGRFNDVQKLVWATLHHLKNLENTNE